jgi:hypothetical protein
LLIYLSGLTYYTWLSGSRIQNRCFSYDSGQKSYFDDYAMPIFWGLTDIKAFATPIEADLLTPLGLNPATETATNTGTMGMQTNPTGTGLISPGPTNTGPSSTGSISTTLGTTTIIANSGSIVYIVNGTATVEVTEPTTSQVGALQTAISNKAQTVKIGMSVGISVGAIAILAAAIYLFYLLRKRQRSNQSLAHEMPYDDSTSQFLTLKAAAFGELPGSLTDKQLIELQVPATEKQYIELQVPASEKAMILPISELPAEEIPVRSWPSDRKY